MAEDNIEITRQDIDGIADKMQAWSENLNDQEQLVIGWILARAMAAENPAVSGYAEGIDAAPTFSGQLAQAAGFGLRGSNAVIVEPFRASHGLAFGRLGK